MKRLAQIAVIVMICLVMFAGFQDGTVKQVVALDEPPNPACWVTTGAFSGEKNLKDHFAGHAAPTVTDNSGPAMGCWRHATTAGDVFAGNVYLLVCLRDGGDPAGGDVYSNLAVMIAEGTWNGKIGYTAQIRAWDHGESEYGSDEYAIAISDPNGNVIYGISGYIDGGNVQIHAVNDPGPEGLGSCD